MSPSLDWISQTRDFFTKRPGLSSVSNKCESSVCYWDSAWCESSGIIRVLNIKGNCWVSLDSVCVHCTASQAGSMCGCKDVAMLLSTAPTGWRCDLCTNRKWLYVYVNKKKNARKLTSARGGRACERRASTWAMNVWFLLLFSNKYSWNQDGFTSTCLLFCPLTLSQPPPLFPQFCWP